MRDTERRAAVRLGGLRHKTVALSVALAVAALGGWGAALAQRVPAPWLMVGAACSLVAVLAAADLMGRLSTVVVQAREAAERAVEGKPRVRIVGRQPRRFPDEADELPGWFNRLLAVLPQSRPRVGGKEHVDPLTGLGSHRHFHERLAEEIRRAERYDHEVSVLMIDLDDFRHTNEAHGHATGDAVLRQCAEVIMGAVRATDLACRYGGDEFAVLLPETGMAGAVQVAGKLRSEVEQRELRLPGLSRQKLDVLARLTVSIGVATFPQHSVRKNGLVMAADVAMYMAKYSGKNKVCPFNRVPGAQEVTDPYQLYQFLQNSDWGALEALVAAVDARDQITGGHSKNVTAYAVVMARAIGLADHDVDAIRAAALLHDVGKIGITDRVLIKNGALTPEERALIESHPAVGESLARRSLNLSGALPGILYHHERYDGKGYPTGLSGEDIPISARIIAIADAYDAMISHRHYRTPPGRTRALRELELGAGQQWDPELVRAFLKLEAQGYLSAAEAADPLLTSAGS